MIYDLSWFGDLLEPVAPGAGEALHGRGTWAAISDPVFTIADALGIDADKITLNFGTLTGALDIQFQISLVTGIILWAGFTAARFITHDAFDRRPAGLTVLNVAHEFVTIVVMALIIGVWPPA